MKIITEEQITGLGISPRQCVEWVEASFRSKPSADMPAKISVHPVEDSFYTAMPCYHPELGRVAVKVVSRVPGRVPSLKSEIMLYDAPTGKLLALIDGNWITAMRTGAVAALAAKTFANDFDNSSFGLVGLGVIGRATLKCLLAIIDPAQKICLLDYKDHVKKIQCEFPDVVFEHTNDRMDLVNRTNVLFSCVTVMHYQFLPPDAYPSGYLCVPVHVRGFQNCDTVFDRVFGDDTSQLKGFKNFTRFRKFAEMSDVLLGRAEGRKRGNERILVYNYGIALHDLWFASRIYDLCYMNV